MKEILRRQMEQHSVIFNRPMPAQEQTSVLMRLLLLQGLLFGETTDRFAIASYWESLSGGRLHVTTDLTDRLGKARKARLSSCNNSTSSIRAAGATVSALTEIEKQGFTVLPPPCPAALVSDLHRSLKRLQACGWPAPFLLVYDEAWLLVDGVWGHYTELLGEDCRLEADLNVWALLTPEQVPPLCITIGCPA
jgi:hypothetical protein